MKLRGPIIVTAGTLALLGSLFGLATVQAAEAQKDRRPAAQAQQAAQTPAPQPTASQTETPSAPTPPPPDPNAPVTTYAGRVDSRTASVAISVRNGQAIAYVCGEGGKLEAWLQGPAGDGQLALTGKNGATLTGTHDGTTATGSTNANGKTLTFKVKMVQAPNGLYKQANQVADKIINGGWIVADGIQEGAVTVNGVTTAAPPINLETGEVVVDGVTIKPPRAQPPA